jgi:hypothetical protein
MALSDYTWTNPSSCSTIAVALTSVTSSAGSISVSYDSANSRYKVEPADYAQLQTHDFSLSLTGTDGQGSTYSETVGPYKLNIICPTDVGVSETSPPATLDYP